MCKSFSQVYEFLWDMRVHVNNLEKQFAVDQMRARKAVNAVPIF